MSATIPMPKMTRRYWIDRARAELAEGRVFSARGSMRRALEDTATNTTVRK